jgi:Spx/MgsR family transcriptional regulator
MIQILGIKNCNTIRDTLRWLDEKGFEYRFVDLKKEPLSEYELAGLARKVGLETLANKRGMKWRTLGLAGRDLSEDELFDLLLEHQTMIKRPVVLRGEAVMIGFDEEALESFLTEE